MVFKNNHLMDSNRALIDLNLLNLLWRVVGSIFWNIDMRKSPI